MQALIEG